MSSSSFYVCFAVAAVGLIADADTNQCSVVPGGPIDGPCERGREYCGPAFNASTPQFHVADLTCAENDPNFPLYDPLHKLYHHFWQAHLATPPGHGPDIGHAVSADLIHWAHLPVAVWNDMPYDNVAIYTGSATIVNGVPTMVYPGLCNKPDWPQCNTGTLFAVALPADHANDPFLTNWSKPAYNPIVENTQRDPSTAWQTAAGEWRFTNYEGIIFSSTDFVRWSRAVDSLVLFPSAECPDFFPVPAACVGNGCDLPPPAGFAPTHVHKISKNRGDFYSFGIYSEGAVGTSGSWTAYNTSEPHGLPLDASQLLGLDTFYASKSFFDPVGSGRRIYWGWARVPPASTQTLPRVTTYHAALQRLIFTPLPELAALRGAPLFSAPSLALAPGANASLSEGWSAGAGNTSEISLSFALPLESATFGVRVIGAAAAPGVYSSLLISFDRAAFTANVSWSAGAPPPAPPPAASYYMPGIDLPGSDFSIENVNYSDPRICQLACNNTPACRAFTYVVRPPLVGACCLKSRYTRQEPRATCTSGVKPGGPPPGPAATSTPIPLLPGDTAIDVRIYLDNTFAEVYLMEGRLALTLTLDGNPISDAAVALFAGSGGSTVTANDVYVWPLSSIWVPPAAVLASRIPVA